MPIAPITGIGAEFRVPGVGEAKGADGAKGFGSMLMDQIGKLEGLEQQADQQSRALATGQAQDVSAVVMAVERASLAVQLATQLRNKTVEAYHDIFRMQI